jgi:OFA family oxalate/formate antiporter-like MFS transporter
MERSNVSNTAAIPPRGANAPVAMNRWLVVVGAVLIQLCLGALYAWSVFTPVLKETPFNFSTQQTQWIFSVGLATFAVAMIFAGRWQPRVGPTIMVRIGGLVLGIGYVLGGLASRSLTGDTAFWALLATLGLIGGAGIGLAYVVPIAVGVKWFPDKKGLITGLAVAGFGFGALIWIYLGQGLPDWTGIKTTGLIKSMGIANVFLTYGIAFFVFVMFGSIWMKNPPAGWSPPGWTGGAPTGKAAAGATVDFEPGQMLATPQFWQLWIMFICGSLAGLMVIGIIKLFGIDALQARAGMTAVQASAVAGTAMALFLALANGFGRIAWGFISDTIGRKTALIVMLTFQGVILLAFFYIGGSPAGLFFGAACVGFNFGGTLALFPAVTADYFGNRNVGKNYGWLFTAYGIGGIVGPIMAARIADTFKGKGVDSWQSAFIIAGVACLVAAVLAMLLRVPRKPQAAARQP